MTKKNVTGRSLKRVAEAIVEQLFNCGKKKTTEVIDKDFNRRKNNVVNLNIFFSTDNVKDISDRISHHGKYGGSGFESDAPIHYDEGHEIDYHENDKTEIKKQKKRKQQKIKIKQLLMKG